VRPSDCGGEVEESTKFKCFKRDEETFSAKEDPEVDIPKD